MRVYVSTLLLTEVSTGEEMYWRTGRVKQRATGHNGESPAQRQRECLFCAFKVLSWGHCQTETGHYSHWRNF